MSRATFGMSQSLFQKLSRAPEFQQFHEHATGIFLLQNFHGHFFAVTGTFPKIATGCSKKCHEEKKNTGVGGGLMTKEFYERNLFKNE